MAFFDTVDPLCLLTYHFECDFLKKICYLKAEQFCKYICPDWYNYLSFFEILDLIYFEKAYGHRQERSK